MLEIRPFDRGNIPAALRLCGQVNWNHIAADWERCLTLNPAACLGGFEDGEMKATCTLAPFGKVGWVGTFLVDQSLRGKGYGKRMFGAIVEAARLQGIECLGLDSSDAGRPIYLKHDFLMTEAGIELWTGPATVDAETKPDTRPMQTTDWAEVLAFDQASVKVPREHQLRTMAGEANTSARVIVENGNLCAFGFSRPGRMSGAIGPVIARDLPSACRMIEALMTDRRRLDGEKAIAITIPDNTALKEWLAARGFQMRRRNIRMFHPEIRDVLASPTVFAPTGLGMG